MAITVADFNRDYPEFKDLKDPIIRRWITLVEKILDEDEWGDLYNDAVSARTAHEISLFNEASGGGTKGGISGAHGQITSASVDGMNTSFAPNPSKNMSDAYLSKTSYGQFYISLRKIALPLGMLTI